MHNCLPRVLYCEKRTIEIVPVGPIPLCGSVALGLVARLGLLLTDNWIVFPGAAVSLPFRMLFHSARLGWFAGALLSAAGGVGLLRAAESTNGSTVHLLVPGFTVRELPVRLSNQNNLRFAPDGTLTALGYDGRIWRLRDTDGDGLEDRADPYWDRATLSVPVGMAWSTHGLYVSSHGKVSRLRDSDGDSRADVEEVVATGWPATDVGSGGVDATAVALDANGNVYFGLLVADYSNAYRLRKYKDLQPAERRWLTAQGRAAEGDPEQEVSLYDIHSKRGTIQKLDPRTHQLTTIATGIRVPYALAFNVAGDLFNTDQEGETWMPNGNPVDELNHIVTGRNYGFPPRHEKWLPEVLNTPPVVGFGPQHESACGLVFNDPQRPSGASGPAVPDVPLPVTPGQGLFGPPSWQGDAFVTGESRGKLWRVRLVKTPEGYVGKEYLIARLDMLVTDVTISPRGDLYLSCHSGPPDWGTGPKGDGKIFQIRYSDPRAPQPLAVWAAGPTEVRVAFDPPVDSSITNSFASGVAAIEFGEYVRAGDRFETLKPPYAAVAQQDATPRGHLAILGATLTDGGRTLILRTASHPLPVTYALTLPGVQAIGSRGRGELVDLDYNLADSSQAGLVRDRAWTRASWQQLAAWAPTQRASSGTDSRPPPFIAGDWEDGRGLFFGEQLGCAKCHRLRGEGGSLGPDLSNLVHRDATSVLRDIRDPNATLHPDYVTHVAELLNGESVTGFIRTEQVNSVRFADANGRETLVRRDQIRDLHPTGQSLMPAGLLERLDERGVRDLLTYLLHEPPVRTRAQVDVMLGPAGAPSNTVPLSLVLVASKQDHGPGQHDYPAWQKKWHRLFATLSPIHSETAWEWPTPAQFASADVLVFYFWNHDWSAERYAQLDAFQARGGGLVFLHSAVIADQNPEQLAERIGLSAQPQRVKYRHTAFALELARGHPLAVGLPGSVPFLDEPYWPLVGDPLRVRVVASAHVDGEPRPLVWTFERGRGRVFVSILGHYTWTLDDPIWRLLCLRGIAWTSQREGVDLRRFATLEGGLK